MTNDAKQSLALATTPEGIVPALLAHINSLDVETMLGFYYPDSIIIDAKGHAHRGADGIGAEFEKYFSFGLQMSITQRHLFVAGDTALLILDWSYIGTARDGTEVNMVATATDIARRGDDGFWRYIIDNPFGSQHRDQH
jgi:ketosteroid isomerase-like protein